MGLLMIIKAKQSQYFKFILLFYSRILTSSKYLNSYFFSLKFLITLIHPSMSFYFLSKSFIPLHQNYISYYVKFFNGVKYLPINQKSITKVNFLYLLFYNIINRKYYTSRLL